MPKLTLLLLILTLASCQTALPPTSESTAMAVAPTTVPPFPTLSPATITPPPTATALPLPTSTLRPTATSAPTATPTATRAWMETAVIGTSVEQHPIELFRFGGGERPFVLAAALHGAHECNTHELAQAFITYFADHPEAVPATITLYILPLLNPDGCAHNSRANAHNVDLNRNWDTPDWTADAQGPNGTIPGSGGMAPFSEPETQVIGYWLRELIAQSPTPPHLISYHSSVPPNGLVQPGYDQNGTVDPAAEALAHAYAEATGYTYSATWVGSYQITGELIYWARLQGIVAIDVELPNGRSAHTIPDGHTETHVETNLRGVGQVLQHYGK